MSYYENRKTEDMPETVNHNSLTDTVRYIRSDIVAKREKEIILYLFNHYGKPIIYSTPKGIDVYGEMGLEKLK